MGNHEADIEYLRSIMVPVLVKGLTNMCKVKPEAPYKWFAEFLLREQEAGFVLPADSTRPMSARRSRPPSAARMRSRTGSFVASDGVSWSQSDTVPPQAQEEFAKEKPKEFHALSVMTTKHLDEVALDPEKSEPVLENKVMKSDHFANIWKLEVKFEGVPNFRKAEGNLPIYGVAQPTEPGIRSVAEFILTGPESHARILWFNMRNEPIAYVNGRPNAPRTKGHLNDNVENPGISVWELEEMEQRLVTDIVEGSQVQGGIFLFYHQAKDMTNEAKWEHVEEPSVKTLRQIYDELQKSGLPVDYVRNPILDEKAPDDVVLDELCRLLEDVPSDTALVFNCQMGRGRTTTGMVSACLIWRAVNNEDPMGEGVMPDPENPDLKNGEFKAVIDLINFLGPETGLKAKQQVDECIDACYHMQNLRTAILECKEEYVKSLGSEGRPPQFWLNRGINYLQRYYTLISFAAYLDQARRAQPKLSSSPYSVWIKSKPEITAILDAANLD